MWSRKSTPTTEALASRLRQLEVRLETLIEGSAARFFPAGRGQPNLAEQMVEAMRQGIHKDENGYLIGPNLFTIEVNPAQAQELAANYALIDELTRCLEEAGREAGLQFASPLVIRIDGIAGIPPNEARAIAYHSQNGLTGTTAVENRADPSLGYGDIPAGAFLIVDGVQIFPLHQGVVNIGRRSDNHLVVDDARISRIHAQIRAVRGYFVIFDLDSTGGTWVNGERVRQKTLQPGDVISLSGVPFVFGQEAGGLDSTQRLP
jgi:FHA domain/FhaA, N-terminal domain